MCTVNKIRDFFIFLHGMLHFFFIFTKYEGCQKSSWTPMIKASNEPDFDIYYYISLK